MLILLNLKKEKKAESAMTGSRNPEGSIIHTGVGFCLALYISHNVRLRTVSNPIRGQLILDIS